MARAFRPTVLPTLFTLAALVVLLALGTWQVQRLHWKTDLLVRINVSMAQKPVPLPEKIDTPQDWEYRRVTMAGHFLYDHEFLVQPRTLDGQNGYHMVVPFRRVSGGTVFVNRGWISSDLMKQAQRPEGIVQVEGIVQMPQKSAFTPENDPAKNAWYWPDIAAMAKAAGIENASPVLVTVAAREEGVYPAGGQVRLDIPNNHKQYAIFWYGMAVVLGLIYIFSHWKDEENAGV